jgi:hypothetical protein
MKIFKLNARSKGLSLVEILIAMSAFAIIFTGLASTFQATAGFNQIAFGLSECLRQYKDGMRLLLEGQPPLIANPHDDDGLLSAEKVGRRSDFTHPDPAYGFVSGALKYTVGENDYVVWISDGKLVRMRDVTPFPTPELLMGEGSSATPKRRIMLSADTTSSNPFGSFSTEENMTPDKTMVRLVIDLHSDFDNDGLPGLAEASLKMRPVVKLRNAK